MKVAQLQFNKTKLGNKSKKLDGKNTEGSNIPKWTYVLSLRGGLHRKSKLHLEAW